MASLVDFLGAQDDATRAATQGGVDTSHLQTILGEDVTDENNRSASNGSFYSGGRSVRENRMGEREQWKVGDIQTGISNKMADLARYRVLASYGLTI